MSKKSKDLAEDAKKLILADLEAQAAQQQRHFDRVTDLQSRSVAALERIADTLATVAKQQRRSRRLKQGTPEKVTPDDWGNVRDIEPPITSQTATTAGMPASAEP